jgi:phage terminase small subunit
MREYSGFFMSNLTPKQEQFCLLYIELGNASAAYREAYDAEDMNQNTVNKNASVMLESTKIATRINQIRDKHMRRHDLTVGDLLAELEEARQAALGAENPQSSAAVAATMGKAKILGLDKQIIDHKSSDGTMTPTRIEIVAPNVHTTD